MTSEISARLGMYGQRYFEDTYCEQSTLRYGYVLAIVNDGKTDKACNTGYTLLKPNTSAATLCYVPC